VCEGKDLCQCFPPAGQSPKIHGFDNYGFKVNLGEGKNQADPFKAWAWLSGKGWHFNRVCQPLLQKCLY
jgi:hypothetical protein